MAVSGGGIETVDGVARAGAFLLARQSGGMDVKALVLLTAALAAMPASAEVYQCRSAQGAELAVQVEVAGNRLAMHDGRKVTLLCGRGAATSCSRMADGGYAYAGALGMIQFVPDTNVFGAPSVLQMRAPGEGAWTKYLCRVGDAGARRRFGR
jgi:hypothetical protein